MFAGPIQSTENKLYRREHSMTLFLDAWFSIIHAHSGMQFCLIFSMEYFMEEFALHIIRLVCMIM